ncbi:acyl-CoA N-acyltransferase [Serendipita vermifera]|nr:acyl-CoA N-acyltransferase [Serendipita vermifera]
MPGPNAPPHEIIPVNDDAPDLVKQCVDLRIAVFVDEQKFPLDTEIDKYDGPGKSTHLLLRLVPSLEPIGTVRLVHLSSTEKKLGRLCVLKEYRNFKFGKDLVLAVHDYLQKQGSPPDAEGPISISLHSQIYVKGFYAKCGYEEVGPEFDEDGAPHQKMVRYLSKSE